LVLQVCIYRTLLTLTLFPPLLTHSLSPGSPDIQQLTVQCVILMYRWVVSIFFILTFSFSLPPPVAPSDRLTKIQFCSVTICVCLYTYVCVYMHVCDHICFYIYIQLTGLASTYERKLVNFYFFFFLSLAYFT
jgi:hypothetical protein